MSRYRRARVCWDVFLYGEFTCTEAFAAGTKLDTHSKLQTLLLDAIHFDTSLLQEANSVADTISALLALANGDRLAGNDGRYLRDQAFTHLKEIVDGVRACGKYVFFSNEIRLRGYSSAYLRNQKKRSRSVAVEVPAES
ncbi:hypothetical protein P886_1331 [Alteromonadaceae bacterium 2753L.S.0a.02]|nr:hypothetical protein P886_1331 [Alteromonadaceae bacterium 2753L.S.0a.02]